MMTTNIKALVDSVAARWARLGVMFNVAATDETVDLERLLLDTARAGEHNTRLLILAVTWLARHGTAVAKHRLEALVRAELEDEHRATLGLMLDLAREASSANRARFDAAIRACDVVIDSGPLAEVERRTAMRRELSERRASKISRKWGRWMEEFEPKNDALRPAHWVMAHNPWLYERQLVGGDLVASILAECDASGGAIESEQDLARRCGASRPAIHAAVEALAATGRIEIESHGRSRHIRLRHIPIPSAPAALANRRESRIMRRL